jgi:membrane fusion protein (multidrug efflux system)
MEPPSTHELPTQTPVAAARQPRPLNNPHRAGVPPPAVDDAREPASPRRRAELPGAQIARLGPWRRVILAVGVVVALAALVVGDQYYVAGPIVHVAPQVAGRVLQVLVTADQPVQAGDLLVEIDPVDFALELVQAGSSAAEARGRLEQASWQLLVAEAERALAEAEVIAAQAHGGNAAAERTDTELELTVAQLKETAAVAQVNLARAQLETAAAGIVTAEAALEQARRRLASTEIRAPQTGQVTTKNVEPGEYVQAGQELLALVADDLGDPATSEQ